MIPSVNSIKTVLIVGVAAIGLSACSGTMGAKDRELLNQASTDAASARTAAVEAASAAQEAARAAESAQRRAEEAAALARKASERSERMFNSSLRK